MKKIKLFVFIPSLRGGGAEKVSSKIASRLDPKLFDTTLVVGKKEGEYVSVLPVNLLVRDLDKAHVRDCIIPLAFLFRREKPDVVISFMHHSNIVALLAKMLSFSSVKIITAERNVMEYVYEHVPKIFLPFARLLYRLSAASLGGSKGLQENVRAFLGIPENKFRVIYNPIDFDFIQSKATEPVHHPWLQDNHPPVVLGVGRLVPQKDFTTLIRAFVLAKKPKGTRLIILGQGPLEEELLVLVEKLGVADSVNFPGFQKNPYPFFANADVFVLSSRWEGFGNVIPEALALGVPIVSTDCEYGPNEIIENEVNGLLVPVHDDKAMASAIGRMLNDKNFARGCAERGQMVAKRLAIEEIAKQYEDFINCVTDNK